MPIRQMRTLLAAVVVALALAVPGGALAAVRAEQPFPSNLFTELDLTQATFLRVDLPKPDCATRPSDCADIDVINTLDGFNIQPRISIPFSGPIDVSTVSSDTVFLLGLSGRRIGINQIVWEPATNTLHVESDEQLAARSPYLLIVTRGVHGADGEPLDRTAFWRDVLFGRPADAAAKRYRTQLGLGLAAAALAGVHPSQIAGASLFTTQSIAAISQKIRAQIRSSACQQRRTSRSEQADERTVFPLASVASIDSRRQTGTSTFVTTPLPLAALQVFPGSVGPSRSARTARRTMRPRRSSSRRSERERERRRRRGRTRSASRSSCLLGQHPRVAGLWRSSGTASPTRRTARRGRSRHRSPTPASRRSRSTSSGTAAAPSVRTRSTEREARPR